MEQAITQRTRTGWALRGCERRYFRRARPPRCKQRFLRRRASHLGSGFIPQFCGERTSALRLGAERSETRPRCCTRRRSNWVYDASANTGYKSTKEMLHLVDLTFNNVLREPCVMANRRVALFSTFNSLVLYGAACESFSH